MSASRFSLPYWTRLICVLLIAMRAHGAPAAKTNEPKAKTAVTFKLGTVAPRDSSFHKILGSMGQSWSAHDVQLRIYPGGIKGGEAEMVRLMRNRALDAALLTAIGLAEIDPASESLQSIPLMFHSLDEFDTVAKRIQPRLEKRLRDKGFVVLFWADAGWVRFFTKSQVTRPDDLRRLKLFTWAGDLLAVDLYKSTGFRPVALETNDILPSLQTGMIQAVPMPPSVALLTQVYVHAPYMLQLDWAPLAGALVVSEASWNKLTPEVQRELARAAAAAGREMKARNRLESDRAVAAMKKHRKFHVTTLTPAVEDEWRRVAETTYGRLRGEKIPVELFDEITRLLAEYRRNHGTGR